MRFGFHLEVIIISNVSVPDKDKDFKGLKRVLRKRFLDWISILEQPNPAIRTPIVPSK